MVKLNEATVAKIRQLSADKTYNYRQLGEMFNVSKECIYRIVNNQTWKHVS